jgi:hypothetical protein
VPVGVSAIRRIGNRGTPAKRQSACSEGGVPPPPYVTVRRVIDHTFGDNRFTQPDEPELPMMQYSRGDTALGSFKSACADS